MVDTSGSVPDTYEEVENTLEVGAGEDQSWLALVIGINLANRVTVGAVGSRYKTNLPLARAGRAFTKALDEDVLGVTRLNRVAVSTTRGFQTSFDESYALLVVHFGCADFKVKGRLRALRVIFVYDQAESFQRVKR